MAGKTLKQEIIQQFKNGASPKNICENLDCSMVAIRRSVNEAIGEGTLRKADLYFAMPDDVRTHINNLRGQETDLNSI